MLLALGTHASYPFLLSLIMIHCAGCHCNFSVSGYTHHLQLTQSPSCAAAYRAQLEHENENEIEEDNDMANEIEEDDGTATFSGDFFGNYRDEDFDWPDGGTSIVDTYLHLLTIAQVPMKILLMMHELLSALFLPWTPASRLSHFHWPQQVLQSLILYMGPPAL